jgi:3-oxoacyl-[acyl-carrier-protein] synthase II
MKKIVITGMGVVTAIGDSVESFWESNLKGKSGLRLEDRMDLSALPCGWVAGVVPEEIKSVIKARWGNSNHAWGDILMHAALDQALTDAKFAGGLKRPAGLAWARVWPGPSGSFPQDYVDHMSGTRLSVISRGTSSAICARSPNRNHWNPATCRRFRRSCRRSSVFH